MGDFQELRARIKVNIYTQTPILQAPKGKAIHPQLCRAGAEVKIQEYLPSNPHFHPKVSHAPPTPLHEGSSPPSPRLPAAEEARSSSRAPGGGCPHHCPTLGESGSGTGSRSSLREVTSHSPPSPIPFRKCRLLTRKPALPVSLIPQTLLPNHQPPPPAV